MSTTNPLTPTGAFRARILEGRALADRGAFEAAEALFRTLLTESRGIEPGNHASALASLATLYGRGGRYLQAHALASQLAVLARDAGAAADPTLAFALAKVCGALAQMGLTEPLEEALRDLRTVLDRCPQPLPNLELEFQIAAASCASAMGDIAGARRHIEAYRCTLERLHVPEEVYTWALTMADGRLLVREGRALEARALVARLGANVPAPAFAVLHILVLEVEVHVALGEREEAVRDGRRALDVLAALDRSTFLAADFVHQGDPLARALERLGEVDLAHRVYDLMALAVLVNLKQVDDCIRALPELGLRDGEAQATLTGFSRLFRREQRALLGRVARLLSRQVDQRVHDLLLQADRPGWVSVCAWCECVRSSEGAWLPIGHYVPREGPFQVTHGICSRCAKAFGGGALTAAER